MEAIWAEDLDKNIGYEGKLPWHIRKDLQFFKKMTMGKTMIMGRKTFEGMDRKILPCRKTIVMTRDRDYHAEGAIILNDMASLDQYMTTHKESFIVIGGTEIFNDLLSQCQILYVTEIQRNYHGDTKAPIIPKDFKVIKQIYAPVSIENEASLVFNFYKRQDS